jgi:hypothetical protein
MEGMATQDLPTQVSLRFNLANGPGNPIFTRHSQQRAFRMGF